MPAVSSSRASPVAMKAPKSATPTPAPPPGRAALTATPPASLTRNGSRASTIDRPASRYIHQPQPPTSGGLAGMPHSASAYTVTATAPGGGSSSHGTEQQLLADLCSPATSTRLLALNTLLAGTRVPAEQRVYPQDTAVLFERLAKLLQDVSLNEIPLVTVVVLHELLDPKHTPDRARMDARKVMPTLLLLLGDQNSKVKKIAVKCLARIVRMCAPHSSVVAAELADTIVKQGLECESWRIRKGAADGCGYILEKGFPAIKAATAELPEPHTRLLLGLVGRLRDISDMVVESAVGALGQIRWIIGDAFLESTLVLRLSGLQLQLYRNFERRVLGVQPRRAGPVSLDPSRAGTATSLRGGAGSNAPRSDASSDDSAQSLPRANSLGPPGGAPPAAATAAVSGMLPRALATDVPDFPPSRPLTAALDRDKERRGLEFGFVPVQLVAGLRAGGPQAAAQRSSAISVLHARVLDIGDMGAVLPHMSELLAFLALLLEDADFKISLTAVAIVQDLVGKLGAGVKAHLSLIVPALIRRFADAKPLIRQATMRTFQQLMTLTMPKPILAMAAGVGAGENFRVREEVLNLTIIALLTYPVTYFDVSVLVADMSHAVQDTKPRVKYVAMEALAVLAQCVGNDKVLRMVREQIGNEDETLHMLRARFNNPELPHINADGMVEHVFGGTNNTSNTVRDAGAAAAAAATATERESSVKGSKADARDEPAPHSHASQPLQSNADSTALQEAQQEREQGGAERTRDRVVSSSTAQSGASARAQTLKLQTSRKVLLEHDGAAGLDSAPATVMFRAAAAAAGGDEMVDEAAATPTGAPTKYARSWSAQGRLGDAARQRKARSSPLQSKNDDDDDDDATDDAEATELASSFAGQPRIMASPTKTQRVRIAARKEEILSRNNSQRDAITLEGAAAAEPVSAAAAAAAASERPKSRAIKPRTTVESEDADEYSVPPSEDIEPKQQQQRGDVAKPSVPRVKAAKPQNTWDDGSADEPAAALAAPKAKAWSIMDNDEESVPPPPKSKAVKPKSTRETSPAPRAKTVKPQSIMDDDEPAAISSVSGSADRPKSRAIKAAGGNQGMSEMPSEYPADTPSEYPLTQQSQPSEYPSEYPPEAAGEPGGDGAPRKAKVALSEATRRRLEARLKKQQQQQTGTSGEAEPSESPIAAVFSAAETSEEPSPPPVVRKAAAPSRFKPVPPRGEAAAPKKEIPEEANALSSITSSQRKRIWKDPGEHFGKNIGVLMKQSADWQEKHAAMEVLVLVSFTDAAAALFAGENPHGLVVCLLTQVANLRSAVSKTAVQLLGSLARLLPAGTFDPDLDGLLLSLAKKLGEGNSWLNEEIERTLNVLEGVSSPVKLLLALTGGAEHKNPQVRGRMALRMAGVVERLTVAQKERLVGGTRELDKLVPVLVQLAGEGQVDARTGAKVVIGHLIPHWPAHERVVEKLVGHKLCQRWRETVEQINKRPAKLAAPSAVASRSASPTKETFADSDGDGGRPMQQQRRASGNVAAAPAGASQSGTLRKKAGPSSAGSTASKTSSSAPSIDPANAELLAEIYARMCETDWSSRNTAVASLIEYIEGHPADMTDSIQANRFLDNFVDRLRDGNSKVQIAALQGIGRIVRTLKVIMDTPQITAFLPALCNAIASTTAAVRTAGLGALDELVEHGEATATLQSIASLLTAGTNVKARSTLIGKLSDALANLEPGRTNVINKFALPCAIKMYTSMPNTSSTATQNEPIIRLLRNLCTRMTAPVFFESPVIKKLDTETRGRIRELL